MGKDELVTFNPRKNVNIQRVDEMKSLGCITDMHCTDLLDEGNPQIYLTSGKGAQSSLRVMRHGLEVTQLAANDMPATPSKVWTVKDHFGDSFDKYIILAFEG